MNRGFKVAALAAALMACADLSTTPAFAADVCSSGNVSIVRVSKLLPNGTLAGFSKAVADHAQWYASHGYKDKIISAPVLVYDKTTNALVQSPDQIMTFHNHAGSVPKDKHDAAWDAYVAEYRANSTITSETIVCMAN